MKDWFLVYFDPIVLEATHSNMLVEPSAEEIVKEEIRQERRERYLSIITRAIEEAKLSNREREVMTITFTERNTYKKAAKRLGIALPSVQMYVKRAIKKIRKKALFLESQGELKLEE